MTMQKLAYYDLVYETIRCIPVGCVASYGQIAFLTGYPRRHRLVGQALSHAPDGAQIPWHRVVHSDGSLIPHDEETQRALLAAEGVICKRNGRVDMRVYQWQPLAPPARREAVRSSCMRITLTKTINPRPTRLEVDGTCLIG